ncbi:hypothetical protein AA80_05955 [Petrotoga sibirica DSM 13575]|uniref:Uncharacterized protein n=2 Tax=Petrotoga sibirica TaxID=156202 RepID=A0A4V3GQG0_9BACT|nr:hypothetical protein [Petrotoga sibirica]POZ88468.1 hypothetical protein AA80_05955 [Petrotoga sibirica DSM 13575]POZ90613.1 hypothetical protein AD60_06365 [Petrotoga sp. SL27]TDX14973.1 hypothetical protein C8D74_1088 [Petrotoga sibirica]
MPVYYLNLTPKYEEGIIHYEVHEDNCTWLSGVKDREKLGNFRDCHGAIKEAQRRYSDWRIDGCKHCSPECHSL